MEVKTKLGILDKLSSVKSRIMDLFEDKDEIFWRAGTWVYKKGKGPKE